MRGVRLGFWLVALAACAIVAQPAQAHIQVSPAAVAPGDPVEFELLVPGERRAHTIEVALKIPEGVLPFSFEDQPRWHRVVEKAGDGSVAVVRWHGDLARDGFVRFSFLAATPEQEGDLVWKAVQRYSDGAEVAWIGGPGSEHPAAVTRVTATTARQNAGGEGSGAAANGESSGGAQVRALTSSTPADATADGDDGFALGLGAAGLALGAIALAVALRRRRPRTGAPRADW